MGIANKLWDFLGSRNLSVYIFIMGLTYILFLAAFGAVVPAWWVNNISNLLPFKVLYILFFINLIICEIKWMPVVVRRCRRPKVPETEADWQRFGRKLTVQSSEFRVQELGKYLKRRGYRIQTTDNRLQTEDLGLESKVSGLESIFYAYKGRFSSIGNILFHLSFLFIVAGVFVSSNYRFEKKVLLMEGQESEDGFKVIRIKPEFWKERLLFTDLLADIESKDGKNVVRLSSSANVRGAKITIQGISYAPKYVLRSLNGGMADVGYVNLANFVPGSVDHFSIPGFPYKIYVSLYPDHEIREGKIGTGSMNLSNPGYVIKVVRGKTLVYSGVLSLKDEAFFDGFGLSFPEIKYNGTFRVVRDPGMRLIVVAFILMGVGLTWKLLFYKREVAVRIFGDATCLYVNSDYYPNLFLKRYMAVIATTTDLE